MLYWLSSLLGAAFGLGAFFLLSEAPLPPPIPTESTYDNMVCIAWDGKEWCRVSSENP